MTRTHRHELDFRSSLIAYGPTSLSLDSPGDRRRFCYYAAKRGIRFEIAKPDATYDVVVLTQGADISLWRRHARNGTKIVFDLPDAYLAVPTFDAKGLLRGLAKFALGQNRSLLLDYTRGLEEMCSRADAVICASEEQAKQVMPFCKNVHIILDFHERAIRTHKNDYGSGQTFNLVWEGLPGNLHFLRKIRDVVLDIQKRRRIAIHAVTALRYRKYLHGRLAQRRTEEEARKILEPLYLYSWNEETISAICCACDMGIIPIPLDDALCAGKPENKLIYFWRLGLPTIATATQSHVRTMSQAGVSMACKTADDWKMMLESYMSNEGVRREAGTKGRRFAEEYASEERLLRQWDDVFRSIALECGGFESSIPEQRAAGAVEAV